MWSQGIRSQGIALNLHGDSPKFPAALEVGERLGSLGANCSTLIRIPQIRRLPLKAGWTWVCSEGYKNLRNVYHDNWGNLMTPRPQRLGVSSWLI